MGVLNYSNIDQTLLFLCSDNGSTKPTPRPGKKKGVATTTKGGVATTAKVGGASSEHEENLCLLRVTNGKKKISTVVS